MSEPFLPEDAPAPEGAPVEEELRLGASDRGKAANGVVIALSRAARSFLLYDPSNEAIRHFLDALRRSSEGYLQAYGDLALEVRPWELVAGGEIVYLDRDRERSIAFRLFRDGVRKLTLDAGLPWAELLKLLEILSIRYTGIRQTEDDMVVLLWKAGFHHIHIEAVEGFVADEEDSGNQLSAQQRQQAKALGVEASAPSDFDLPIARPQGLAAVRWEDVPQAAVEAVLAEDDNIALGRLCVKLVVELCRMVMDPTEKIGFEDVQVQLQEIRDFLLAEGQLEMVNTLVAGLGRLRFRDERDERGRAAFIASFADEHAIGRLVAGASKATQTAPPELIQLLAMLPGNHPAVLIRLLGTARSEASRRVSRSLLEHYAATAGDQIVAAIPTADPLVAVELLHVLRGVDVQKALDAATAIAASGDLEVQLEGLHCIAAAPPGDASARLVVTLLDSPHLDVRLRALEEAARLRVKGAYGPILERLKRLAPLGFDAREADGIGAALYHCDPATAMRQFEEWAKPKGFFRQVLPSHPWLQFAAVSGLSWAPGDEPEQLIKFVAERAGEMVQKHCTEVMIRRRRRARGLKA